MFVVLLRRNLVKLFILTLFFLSLPLYKVSLVYAAGLSLVVNSVNDSGDSDLSDGICRDSTGFCTLRAAIEQSNATPGKDTITFAIPGAGVHTIRPSFGYVVTDSVDIDGYMPDITQATESTPAALLIELDGSNLAGAASGITLFAGDSTISGLVINRFSAGAGISLSGAGASNNIIEGNYIGTDPLGNEIRGNGSGVSMTNGASNNLVGGASPAARNIISGNGDGIFIDNAATNANRIVGNFIGENATGNGALGNTGLGVRIGPGFMPGEDGGAPNTFIIGNVIGGNGFSAIAVTGIDSTGTIIRGNLLGTDATGSFAIPNNGGMALTRSSRNTTVGGPNPSDRNVISGNHGVGMSIVRFSSGNIIQGNYIGTDRSGLSPLGNESQGIVVIASGSDSLIGGTQSGEGNIIAYNGVGIQNFSGATGIEIIGNQIFSNASLGINLGTDGVTPNDSGDGDVGPNNLQNYPDLLMASPGNVIGVLSSTPNTTYRIEFFSNTTCDPSDFGEGEHFVTFSTVTTDMNGNAPFTTTLPMTVPIGHFMTATATDPTGNTSEFSQCREVTTAGMDIEHLITVVEAYNLQQGIENSLDMKLEAALDAATATTNGDNSSAISKLQAFISEVEAQRGKKLTNEQADELIYIATNIITRLQNGY